jgi:hypothetical protein
MVSTSAAAPFFSYQAARMIVVLVGWVERSETHQGP